MTPTRVTITVAGNIEISFAEVEEDDANPWDKVLQHGKAT